MLRNNLQAKLRRLHQMVQTDGPDVVLNMLKRSPADDVFGVLLTKIKGYTATKDKLSYLRETVRALKPYQDRSEGSPFNDVLTAFEDLSPYVAGESLLANNPVFSTNRVSRGNVLSAFDRIRMEVLGSKAQYARGDKYLMPMGTIDFSTEPQEIRLPRNHLAEVRLPLESEQAGLEKQRLQTVVTNNQGRNFYADLVTPIYVQGTMLNQSATGENAGGLYYPGTNTLIVRELTLKTVKSVLEDVVISKRVPFFFKEIT